MMEETILKKLKIEWKGKKSQEKIILKTKD